MNDLRLSQGFDAGTYCSAYETEDYDLAKSKHLQGSGESFAIAFILGFFSSYETHEIPETHRDDFVAAYHSWHGQRVLELGYCDRRGELDD